MWWKTRFDILMNKLIYALKVLKMNKACYAFENISGMKTVEYLAIGVFWQIYSEFCGKVKLPSEYSISFVVPLFKENFYFGE